MAMAVDMRGIKTVLGSHTPVALDRGAYHGVRYQMLVPKTRLRVLMDVHRGIIADPDENDLVFLKSRIGLETHLTAQGAVSLGEDLD